MEQETIAERSAIGIGMSEDRRYLCTTITEIGKKQFCLEDSHCINQEKETKKR